MQQVEVLEINADQLKRMITLHVAFALFDIRTKEEFNLKHIPNALHLEGLDHLQRLIKTKDAAIVVYDNEEECALSFTQQATDAGFINIVYLKGGIKNYSS